jgi:hypothetical protein
LTRWNDTIGEPITPEPIDWARWRAEHLPSPLAPPPGLSRLQRAHGKESAQGHAEGGGLAL